MFWCYLWIFIPRTESPIYEYKNDRACNCKIKLSIMKAVIVYADDQVLLTEGQGYLQNSVIVYFRITIMATIGKHVIRYIFYTIE